MTARLTSLDLVTASVEDLIAILHRSTSLQKLHINLYAPNLTGVEFDLSPLGDALSALRLVELSFSIDDPVAAWPQVTSVALQHLRLLNVTGFYFDANWWRFVCQFPNLTTLILVCESCEKADALDLHTVMDRGSGSQLWSSLTDLTLENYSQDGASDLFDAFSPTLRFFHWSRSHLRLSTPTQLLGTL